MADAQEKIDTDELVTRLKSQAERVGYDDDVSGVELELPESMAATGFDLGSGKPRVRFRPELGFSSKPVIGPVITLVKRFYLRLLFHVFDDLARQTDAALERLESSLAVEIAERERLERRVDEREARLESRERALDDLVDLVVFDPNAPHPLDDLGEQIARVLNYEAGHRGFASQSGLWFNPPVHVEYEPGDVHLRAVNERVVEAPYVFRALRAVEPGAKVLDVGAAESTVCLSLATLGYRVTAIDPRPIPLVHERLETVVGGIEDFEPDGEFAAVVCLSTIEHLGTGAYEQESDDSRPDLDAMRRMRELTRDGGLLVLTTAVGEPSVDEFSRVYDQEGLDRLLDGWQVTDLTLVQRRDSTTWVTIEGSIDDLKPGAETVAMVTATAA